VTQLRISTFIAFLFTAAADFGQQPLGVENVLSDSTIGALDQAVPIPACPFDGVCGIFWEAFSPANHAAPNQIWGATYSNTGGLLVRKGLATSENGLFPVPVALSSGFALFWEQEFPDRHVSPVMQLYYDNLEAQGPLIELPFRGTGDPSDPRDFGSVLAAQRTAEGFALLSSASLSLPIDVRNGMFLYFVSDRGLVLRERVQVSEDSNGDYRPAVFRGGLSQDADGNFVVAYSRLVEGPLGPSDVYVRRISRTGVPLGHEVRANTYLAGEQTNPQVAASPDGQFLVVWQSAGEDGSSDGIYGRRFSAEGQPLGQEFRVNEVTASAQRFPLVTPDAFGNYFVAWSSGHPTSETIGYEVKGRLYHHDGMPVGAEIHVNQDRLFDQMGGWAAFSGNGTLLVAWQSESSRQAGDALRVPVARRFSASPGQEICAIDGAAIACDLARTGGDLELQLTWGGRPGEVTLFGDWDGDGRDDVCAFFRGRFRCDLNHNGPPAEAFESFGREGDIPLLADVDGDHRADPCVRRGSDLLCDTRHDGRVHLQVHFGDGSETPLLGDLDGDGRADLCLFRDGDWRCRLAKSGVEQHFAFGKTGDTPALGDADRDGRADLCLLRAGMLLCDTGHDGGAAEFQLALEAPLGARILFANLDGL
jgi:hypothetical protein